MEIINKYPVMVFKQEFQGKTLYSIGLSKKEQDGKYVNGYKMVRFKKGVELENRTKININKAFLDFYITKDNKTMDYIFITEFEKTNNEVVKNDSVIEYTQDNILEDSDLPF